MDTTTHWYWEGNVVETVDRFLQECGWKIELKADTRTRQRGVDIRARRDNRTLLVEVKGYPSRGYRDPRRVGETKPTNPTNQAQHWYSHALLKAMRLQTEYPDADVAIAFPDFPRYRSLFSETQGGLAKLGVGMLTVHENGRVAVWGVRCEP